MNPQEYVCSLSEGLKALITSMPVLLMDTGILKMDKKLSMHYKLI